MSVIETDLAKLAESLPCYATPLAALTSRWHVFR